VANSFVKRLYKKSYKKRSFEQIHIEAYTALLNPPFPERGGGQHLLKIALAAGSVPQKKPFRHGIVRLIIVAGGQKIVHIMPPEKPKAAELQTTLRE
jgi:hypothetical protein